MSVETWAERAPDGAPDRVAARARNGKLRPRLGPADTLLQLWRAKWLMLMALLPVVLVALMFILLTPTHYAANARLLVRLGQEYAFDPVIGDAMRAAFPQQADVLQAEAELARSPVIAERTIRAVGLSRLYPRLAVARLRASDGDGYVIDQEALEVFDRNVSVTTSPRSPILHMTFRHEDPGLAAETLNRFVAEYQAYRQEVLSGQGVQGLAEQRGLIEARLIEADRALRDYLARNGVSDYDAELAAATRLFSDISDERARVEASLHEAEARSEGLAKQMSATPREVDLYVETTSEQELVRLRLMREDLLTRYLPDSRAVQDVERRIAQMEAFLASAPAQGLRRIGPNPIWQTLETDRAAQSATVNALAGRLAALEAQQAEAEARMARLDQLKPDYLRLKRERDALEASAGALAMREQAERARVELASRSVDNIYVYEAARAPARDDGGKWTIGIVAAVSGLFSMLAVGLLRVWSVAGLPTAASVERTLGLKVLAATRER